MAFLSCLLLLPPQSNLPFFLFLEFFFCCLEFALQRDSTLAGTSMWKANFGRLGLFCCFVL